jgi:hypothetical protein
VDEVVPVEAFLGRRPGSFCDACIADALGIPDEDVKTEIFSRSREFARVVGSCSLCRQRTAVTAQRRTA